MEEKLILSDSIPEKLNEILTNTFNFKSLTPVQQVVIPTFSGRKDVAVQSETGSGKTIAFAVPIFAHFLEENQENTDDNKCCQVLVILPTRVLAQQVFNVFSKFANNKAFEKVGLALLCGGNTDDQLINCKTIATANIIIATPGRLVYAIGCKYKENSIDDLKEEDKVNLSKVKIFVVDEADKLLDGSYEHELTFILSAMPKQKKIGLFSATLDSNIIDIEKICMRNPHEIRISNSSASKSANENIEAYVVPEKLSCWYVVVPYECKINFLINYLKLSMNKGKKIIVFCLTCSMSEYLRAITEHILNSKKDDVNFSAKNAKSLAYYVYCLNGRQKTTKQARQLELFMKDKPNNSTSILFTTDIAARGIDADNLTVLQFDPPSQLATFLHRAGRTARNFKMGAAGLVITPQELGVVLLLRNRGVPILELFGKTGIPTSLEETKKALSQQIFENEKSLINKTFKQYTNFFTRDRNTNIVEPLAQWKKNDAEFIIEKSLLPTYNKETGEKITLSDAVLHAEMFSNALSNQLKSLTKRIKLLEKKKGQIAEKIDFAQKQMDELKEQKKELGAENYSSSIAIFNNQIQSIEKHGIAPLNKLRNVLLEIEKRYHNLIIESVYEDEITIRLRKMELNDRNIFDVAQNAFISYLRGSKETELKIVFDAERIPLGPLAVSMGMLKLPIHIVELKQKYLIFKCPEINIDEIKYVDPQQEASRIRKLKEAQEKQSMKQNKILKLNNNNHQDIEYKNDEEKDYLSETKEEQDDCNNDDEKKAEKINCGDILDDFDDKKKSKTMTNNNIDDNFDEEAFIQGINNIKNNNKFDAKFLTEERLLKYLKMGKISEDKFDELCEKIILNGYNGTNKKAKGKKQKNKNLL